MKDHKKEKHDNITEEIKSEGEVVGADTEQTNATASEKDQEGEKGQTGQNGIKEVALMNNYLLHLPPLYKPENLISERCLAQYPISC